MKLSGREQADITGLIGQYAHGNEPSHHMAYLYNFTNAPYKTQLYVDRILKEMYQNAPDGLAGNEDCGQMSAIIQCGKRLRRVMLFCQQAISAEAACFFVTKMGPGVRNTGPHFWGVTN
jgi:hypothetical protein